ncbi:MAG: ABC transporter ATP-binding protein [Thermoanaerobacterales bacterium]|nr:ABC transporter ATP-binding protein [Thermoanaerobacterales bacterium]
MEKVIETGRLTKLYGSGLGCAEICLSIAGGQIFGFLGPNGAGKSTLVKVLVGLLRPTSGEARVLGRPLGDLAARRRIGYLPEQFRYQEWLSGAEVLALHARLCGLDRGTARQRIGRVLETVGLAGRERGRVRTYSKGMQQRLGLAVALVGDPDLVFLDEPTSALDPLGRREVREIILELKRAGKTVFLNSHLLSEVEMVCDEVAFIKAGRIVRAGPLNELLAGAATVEMEVADLTGEAEEELVRVAVSLRCLENGRFLVHLARREDIPVLAEIVTRHGARLYTLAPRQRSLEDLFVELVGEGKGVEPHVGHRRDHRA